MDTKRLNYMQNGGDTAKLDDESKYRYGIIDEGKILILEVGQGGFGQK